MESGCVFVWWMKEEGMGLKEGNKTRNGFDRVAQITVGK